MNGVAAVLPVSFAVFVCGYAAPGLTQDTLKTYEIDETVVTATRTVTPLSDIPQPVTVVSSTEIEESPAYNVGEMLGSVPGVRIISAGTVGRAQGVSMRSLNGGRYSDKVLVLMDGRPVNDAWEGGVNWNSIPLDLVERVEVVRGPGSALYGSQASGGIISVFTRNPEPGFHGWFTVGHEINAAEDITDTAAKGYGRADVDATRVGLSGSYGSGRMGHYVSLGYRDAVESYPTPNDNAWGNYDLFYKGDLSVSPRLTMQLSIGLHQDAWENEAENVPTKDTTDNQSIDLFARWLKGLGIMTGRVYFNRAKGESEALATAVATGQTSDRFGFTADYALPLAGEAILTAGIEGRFDVTDVNYDLTVMNMTALGVGTVNFKNSRTGEVTQVQADIFSGTYGSSSQSYNEQAFALFVQYSRHLGDRLNVVGGARLDMHSEFGAILNPKAGLTYELINHADFGATLKLNYGTAFRAPPMVDLFSKSISGYGNPDMKPEKTKNIDLGLFQQLGRMGYAELTFFHMDVTDLMINDKSGATGNGYYVFVPTSSGADTLSFNQRTNRGSYSPRGVELGFRVLPHRQISMSGAYTYLDPGNFTFQTSRHRWNMALGGFVPLGGNRIEAEIQYNYTGDGYFFDYESRPFDAFAITSARLTLACRDRTRVSLHVRNLFDETYRLWHYAWQPGRTLLVSIDTGF